MQVPRHHPSNVVCEFDGGRGVCHLPPPLDSVDVDSIEEGKERLNHQTAESEDGVGGKGKRPQVLRRCARAYDDRVLHIPGIWKHHQLVEKRCG